MIGEITSANDSSEVSKLLKKTDGQESKTKKKICYFIKETAIFMAIGAISGLGNSIGDILYNDEKISQMGWDTLAGAGLGFFGGWIGVVLKKTAKKCCSCFSCFSCFSDSEKSGAKKCLNGTCLNGVKGGLSKCAKIGWKLFKRSFPSILAGFAAAASDDTVERKLEPFGPQMRDVVIGVVVGLFEGIIDFSIRNGKDMCCSKSHQYEPA